MDICDDDDMPYDYTAKRLRREADKLPARRLVRKSRVEIPWHDNEPPDRRAVITPVNRHGNPVPAKPYRPKPGSNSLFAHALADAVQYTMRKISEPWVPHFRDPTPDDIAAFRESVEKAAASDSAKRDRKGQKRRRQPNDNAGGSPSGEITDISLTGITAAHHNRPAA